MLKNRKFLFIALLACIVSSLGAQTDSPYSRYGYGMLRDQAVGPSKSMGGIGYGLRNSQSANPINPASYSRVDSLTFLFDIGINFNSGKLSDGTNSEQKYNGGLDYITILIPIKKRLGLSFGILPYSSVGYKFGATVTNGSVSYLKSFNGSGGLSQIYGGVGYLTPLKGLSVGANVSYLFGTIEHTRSLPKISGTGTYLSTDNSELTVKAAKFDIGAQYEMFIAKDKKLTLGAVFSPKINTKANYQNIHYLYQQSNSALVQGDTTFVKGVDAGIPSTYGLGFTINNNDRLIFGADVTYQQWKDAKYSPYMNDGLDDGKRFNDRWKYSAGVEYMVDPYDRSYLKKMKFRGGVNYSNSYMNVMDKQGNIDGYKEYGATLGLGLPIKDNIGGRISYININFEYKKMKPKFSSMISEEYFGVSLNMNINELWFFRRKVE
ncbi:outer membrane protein transport protein [Dysgonomonas sp. Marseille-P4677]|uniref:outer membrane protein transport protein n=1 Tax=Dysgonomonas sp. Marseille-P4677 TaxID=2364790 RepID=UPI0019118E26|nr:outer membrane protein transport protein [Dysgonomonas sp. Marseille-P4677]MBK5722928.1 outer membrane protein transport protein [Dysgonomonas sp. Marseille-P4677]